jgi:hypothetical protein
MVLVCTQPRGFDGTSVSFVISVVLLPAVHAVHVVHAEHAGCMSIVLVLPAVLMLQGAATTVHCQVLMLFQGHACVLSLLVCAFRTQLVTATMFVRKCVHFVFTP